MIIQMEVVEGMLCEDMYSENAEIYLNARCLGEEDVSFNSGKKVLHQIQAKLNSVSIHIYAPPNYVPTKYI